MLYYSIVIRGWIKHKMDFFPGRKVSESRKSQSRGLVYHRQFRKMSEQEGHNWLFRVWRHKGVLWDKLTWSSSLLYLLTCKYLKKFNEKNHEMSLIKPENLMIWSCYSESILSNKGLLLYCKIFFTQIAINSYNEKKPDINLARENIFEKLLFPFRISMRKTNLHHLTHIKMQLKENFFKIRSTNITLYD